jgi:hypothetical protein
MIAPTPKSHTARNVAIVGVVILLLGFFFLVPVVQANNGLNIFGLVGANATVSLSCQVFGFGEVHVTTNFLSIQTDKWGWSTNC